MTKEKWRSIPLKEHYSASNLGRIRSEDCYRNGARNGHKRFKRGCILKLSLNSSTGYLQVTLQRKTYSVHRLVAMAFHGTPNGNDDVNHINGNRQDNRASNLEWCTRSHNQLHRHHEINDVLGDVKLRRGEASGMSKLTAKMISDAREMRANGQTYIAIARHFSVHETTIFLALKRKTWKHL